MTENEKIERFDQIKALLDGMDMEAQRLIVWSHLSSLVALEFTNLTWIMEQLGILIQAQDDKRVRLQ